VGVEVREPAGRAVAGLDYLESVTRLLQRRRLAEPARETWEAAELQWWWTRDRHEDSSRARVWSDADGPVAAVSLTRWTSARFSCEVLAEPDFAPAWRFAAECSDRRRGASVEMEIIDSDVDRQHAARAIGYVPSDETYVVSWLDAAGVKATGRSLADGYEVVPRSGCGDRPHPMIRRNGIAVADALRQCSLYDPELDLTIRAEDGTFAGYALFWADPVTNVGLLEPMRVEDAHAGRGLATQLLSAGLQRLVDRGCTRLKVVANSSNPVSQRLYRGAGFVASDLGRVWHHEYRG